MREPRRTGRLPLAVVPLRAIAIVAACLASAWLLLAEGIERSIFAEPLPSSLDWSSVVATVRESSDAFDGLLVTLQLAAAGAAIALLVAAVLSLLSRWRRFGDLVRLSIVPLVSLLTPVSALLSYWVALKLGAAPAAFEGIEAGFDAAVSNGWLPATVVALSMLPGLSALLNRKAPALAELGWASATAQLASRSAPHGHWMLGLPATATILALAVVESLYAPTGLFGRFTRSLDSADPELLLVMIFLVAAAGAILAMAVDLFGRSAPDDETHEFAGLRAPTDGRTAAFGFAVGTVGLGALLVAALIGGSLDAGVGTLADPLSGPFSNGYLLGSDGDGRDLLNLTLAATGSVLQRSLIPAAIASLVGAVLAAAAHYLPRIGRVVPGVLVDLLWWPAPLFGTLAIAVWGVGDELQLLTSAILVPLAYRLCRREVFGVPVGTGRRFGGVVALIAAAAFAIDTVLGFIAASSYPIDANWGSQLASSSETLADSVWPALIPSVAIVLFAFVLNLAGSYLVASGWAAWLASPEARHAATQARQEASAPAPVPANGESDEPDEPEGPQGPLLLPAATAASTDADEVTDPDATHPDAADADAVEPAAPIRRLDSPTSESPADRPMPPPTRPQEPPPAAPAPDRPMAPPAANPPDRPMAPPAAKAPDRLMSPPPMMPSGPTEPPTES